MRKPPFAALYSNYSSNKKIAKDALFKEIGWNDLINDQTYDNTCAVRVSLALIKAGIPLRGRIKIKVGPNKGALIEPGQQKLAELLASDAYFWKPEKLSAKNAGAKIGSRQGIIAFMRIPGYHNGRGGHIDLVSVSAGGYYACASDCYWNASEIWFWKLK